MHIFSSIVIEEATTILCVKKELKRRKKVYALEYRIFLKNQPAILSSSTDSQHLPNQSLAILCLLIQRIHFNKELKHVGRTNTS